ncbi:hypothetical protein T492DRAFT_314306 [Pavlovales sp. CCMP2436]|nr:hypothetical protein T492DRAFT_314306 [Pavlovales sp. CCMP2436]
MMPDSMLGKTLVSTFIVFCGAAGLAIGNRIYGRSMLMAMVRYITCSCADRPALLPPPRSLTAVVRFPSDARAGPARCARERARAREEGARPPMTPPRTSVRCSRHAPSPMAMGDAGHRRGSSASRGQ